MIGRLSLKIAELCREDLQRDGGSSNNESEIEILRRIELILQNPDTYNVMEYPTFAIIDHLEKYGVIDAPEKEDLLHQLRATKAKPFIPTT